VFAIVIVFGLPITVAILLFKRFKYLDEPLYKERFGSLYEE
jgi:hypothetical protein